MDLPKVSEAIFNSQNENITKIEKLFPSVVKDGQVDFEALKEFFGIYEEVENEKYELTWHGKKKSKNFAEQDISGQTLKYLKDENIGSESSENLYIEGDNLEALKLLRQNYYQAIDIIYIDPPYNTGNDFIYEDKFLNSDIDTLEGNVVDNVRLTLNKNTSSKYHTNWLNMLYPRLLVARDLLTDDGVIFISIGDEEIDNLLKLCEEVFGWKNIVANLVWEKKRKGAFLDGHITNIKEYIVVVAKDSSRFKGLLGEINYNEETYPCIKTTNARGVRKISKGISSTFKEKNHFVSKGTRISSGNMELILLDDLIIKDGFLAEDVRIDSNWIYGQETLDSYAKKGELYITRDLYLRRRVTDPREKRLKDILFKTGKNEVVDIETDSLKNIRYKKSDNLYDDGWGTNEDGNQELHELLGVQNLFDFPKPSKLIAKLIYAVSNKNALVLDFFSGSATTADAVLQLNSQDSGNRKFIMVQVAENLLETLEKVPANKKASIQATIDFLATLNKPPYLTEIGKERVKRSIERIKQKSTSKLNNIDLGMKVFKVENTNIRWTHEALTEGQIAADEAEMTDKDKLDFMPGTKDIDVVYEVMLRQRDVPLSSSVELLLDIGARTYMFADSYVVCLEEDITAELVEKLAAIDPLPIKYVLRDSAFGDNISLKEETFRRLQLLVERNTGVSKKTYTVEFL